MGITTNWNEHEDAALYELPHRAQLLYLRCLRRYMDYSTGVVGRSREVSRDMFCDVLEVSESYTANNRRAKPTLREVRISLSQLERVGLIERLPGRRVSKLIETYVFFLPLAAWDNSVSNSDVTVTSQSRHTSHVTTEPELKENVTQSDVTVTSQSRHTSHVTHPVSGNTTATTHAREARFFAMHEGWVADGESLKAHARMQGVLIDSLPTDGYAEVLGEFKSFWMGQAREETQAGWEGKLVKSIKHKLSQPKGGGDGQSRASGCGGKSGADNFISGIKKRAQQRGGDQ